MRAHPHPASLEDAERTLGDALPRVAAAEGRRDIRQDKDAGVRASAQRHDTPPETVQPGRQEAVVPGVTDPVGLWWDVCREGQRGATEAYESTIRGQTRDLIDGDRQDRAARRRGLRCRIRGWCRGRL